MIFCIKAEVFGDRLADVLEGWQVRVWSDFFTRLAKRFGAEMLSAKKQMGEWLCYYSFGCCNVNNLQSCLVCICLSLSIRIILHQ